MVFVSSSRKELLACQHSSVLAYVTVREVAAADPYLPGVANRMEFILFFCRLFVGSCFTFIVPFRSDSMELLWANGIPIKKRQVEAMRSFHGLLVFFEM